MVPVVDIGAFLDCLEKGGEEGRLALMQTRPEVKTTISLVHEAMCSYGFCYLTNHGVPQHLTDRIFASSKQFFELDLEVKNRYRKGEGSHGYVGVETQKYVMYPKADEFAYRLNQSRPHADMLEAFNFNPCEEKDFPSEVPDMDQSFREMFRSCHVLSCYVLDLMGMAFELEDPTLLSRSHQLSGQKGSYTALRSNYYPPCTQLKEGQIQCGEHSDFGAITLLFQDDIGGLQILGKDGEYQDVIPEPGAVLINVGDLIQRWTADKYPATKHRVVIPREALVRGRARQSLAFFCQPDNDTLITPLDGSSLYPPITSYDHLMSRFAAISY